MSKVPSRICFRVSGDGVQFFGTRRLPPCCQEPIQEISTSLAVIQELYPAWKGFFLLVAVDFSKSTVELGFNFGLYNKYRYTCSHAKALQSISSALEYPLILPVVEDGHWAEFLDALSHSFNAQEALVSCIN